jgi:hypothetical protein
MIGANSTKNAARHPNSAPATPATAGPRMAPRYTALVWFAKAVGRALGV